MKNMFHNEKIVKYKQESEKMIKNKDYFLREVKNDKAYGLIKAPSEFLEDKDFMEKCIKLNFKIFPFFSKKLTEDKDIVLKLIKIEPYILKELVEEDFLKNDLEINYQAVCVENWLVGNVGEKIKEKIGNINQEEFILELGKLALEEKNNNILDKIDMKEQVFKKIKI